MKIENGYIVLCRTMPSQPNPVENPRERDTNQPIRNRGVMDKWGLWRDLGKSHSTSPQSGCTQSPDFPKGQKWPCCNPVPDHFTRGIGEYSRRIWGHLVEKLHTNYHSSSSTFFHSFYFFCSSVPLFLFLILNSSPSLPRLHLSPTPPCHPNKSSCRKQNPSRKSTQRTTPR